MVKIDSTGLSFSSWSHKKLIRTSPDQSAEFKLHVRASHQFEHCFWKRLWPATATHSLTFTLARLCFKVKWCGSMLHLTMNVFKFRLSDLGIVLSPITCFCCLSVTFILMRSVISADSILEWSIISLCWYQDSLSSLLLSPSTISHLVKISRRSKS